MRSSGLRSKLKRYQSRQPQDTRYPPQTTRVCDGSTPTMKRPRPQWPQPAPGKARVKKMKTKNSTTSFLRSDERCLRSPPVQCICICVSIVLFVCTYASKRQDKEPPNRLLSQTRNGDTRTLMQGRPNKRKMLQAKTNIHTHLL